MSYLNNHFKAPSDLKKPKKQKYSYTDKSIDFNVCVIIYEIIKEILTFTCFSLFPEVKTIVTYIFIFL